MTVRVRAFATLRDRLGDAEVALDVADGATVREALEALEAEHAGLAGELLAGGEIQRSVTVLQNGQRVGDPDTERLEDGDELVLAPPVTGG